MTAQSRRRVGFSALLTSLVVAASFSGSCSSAPITTASAGAGAASSSGTEASSGSGQGGQGGVDIFPDGGSGGGKMVSTTYPCKGCTAFPPLGAPACDPAKLAESQIAYPLDGLLLPPNMNVLEVQFVPPNGATLFEVDFENAITDVKVETMCTPVPPVRGGASLGCGLTLPQAAWNDIANTNRDGDPVHVTVRATTDGSCVSTSTAKIDILFAKEDIVGGIYYWQSAVYGGIGGKTGGIYSHDFGSLDPTPTPFYTSGGTGTCVGCHYLSRDGARMSLATDDPDADDEFADVKSHLMDVATRTVLGGAKMSPGFQTFTHDHTKLIASNWKQKNLSFTINDGDTAALLATAVLPVGMAGTQPDLAKDDKTLVYVVPQAGTISSAGDHHFMGGSLYLSTFDAAANTLGAPSLLLAATGTQNFFYPAITPESSFVVFNDAPDGDSFYNRKSRVKLLHLPAKPGATPIDLPALNIADGLSNSWPRWSPFVQTYKGHKLLWVTFSSNRDYGLHLVNKGFDNCYPPESPAYDQPQPLSKQGVGYENCGQPQIWMAAVRVDADPSLDATDRSFPAFWLPFQDVNSHNHAAQWVEQVQGGGDVDGGTCGELNAACGAATCCSDVVCCNGICSYSCIK
jgi:hypothetical protein